MVIFSSKKSSKYSLNANMTHRTVIVHTFDHKPTDEEIYSIIERFKDKVPYKMSDNKYGTFTPADFTLHKIEEGV